jgi:hypothetical protein
MGENSNDLQSLSSPLHVLNALSLVRLGAEINIAAEKSTSRGLIPEVLESIMKIVLCIIKA